MVHRYYSGVYNVILDECSRIQVLNFIEVMHAISNFLNDNIIQAGKQLYN